MGGGGDKIAEHVLKKSSIYRIIIRSPNVSFTFMLKDMTMKTFSKGCL